MFPNESKSYLKESEDYEMYKAQNCEYLQLNDKHSPGVSEVYIVPKGKRPTTMRQSVFKVNSQKQKRTNTIIEIIIRKGCKSHGHLWISSLPQVSNVCTNL